MCEAHDVARSIAHEHSIVWKMMKGSRYSVLIRPQTTLLTLHTHAR